MKRIIIVLTIFSLALIARDNPFKPVVSNATMGKATNIAQLYKPLKIEKFKLNLKGPPTSWSNKEG